MSIVAEINEVEHQVIYCGVLNNGKHQRADQPESSSINSQMTLESERWGLGNALDNGSDDKEVVKSIRLKRIK